MKHKRYKKVCKVYFLELGILSMDELLRVYVIYFNINKYNFLIP